jgi:site-specific recombinase XerD
MPETEIRKLLKDYLDYLEIEKNRSPKTRENYEHYLNVFIDFSKITAPKEITDSAVREFRLALARPRYAKGSGEANPDFVQKNSGTHEHRVPLETNSLKKLTQSYYVIAIRNFLKYLARRDIKTLAAEKIELPKTPSRQIEILEYKDLERLLAAPKGDGLRALRDKAILETFFSTGLRLSELCALDRTIDLRRGEISVRGKGDKLRVVFIADSARQAIQNYLTKRTDTEEALFISIDRSGKVIGRITARAVQRLIALRAREAGIPKHVHAHELRHSFATDLLMNGADLRSVQELLGHSNISTTQAYTHLTNKALREVHEAFHGKRRDK